MQYLAKYPLETCFLRRLWSPESKILLYQHRAQNLDPTPQSCNQSPRARRHRRRQYIYKGCRRQPPCYSAALPRAGRVDAAPRPRIPHSLCCVGGSLQCVKDFYFLFFKTVNWWITRDTWNLVVVFLSGRIYLFLFIFSFCISSSFPFDFFLFSLRSSDWNQRKFLWLERCGDVWRPTMTQNLRKASSYILCCNILVPIPYGGWEMCFQSERGIC